MAEGQRRAPADGCQAQAGSAESAIAAWAITASRGAGCLWPILHRAGRMSTFRLGGHHRWRVSIRSGSDIAGIRQGEGSGSSVSSTWRPCQRRPSRSPPHGIVLPNSYAVVTHDRYGRRMCGVSGISLAYGATVGTSAPGSTPATRSAAPTCSPWRPAVPPSPSPTRPSARRRRRARRSGPGHRRDLGEVGRAAGLSTHRRGQAAGVSVPLEETQAFKEWPRDRPRDDADTSGSVDK